MSWVETSLALPTQPSPLCYLTQVVAAAAAAAKMHQIRFRVQIPLGELTALPDPCLLSGPTSKGRGREGKERREERGRGVKEREGDPPVFNRTLVRRRKLQNEA